MRLKVIIPPFFIVMTLILGIGYIKPDIDALLVKQAEILAKEALVADVGTVIGNIDTLNKSLDMQPDFEKLVYRYLPETLNQELGIDVFNFLATQSGVVIAGMKLTVPVSQAVLGEDSSAVPGVSTASSLPVAKTFTFTGSVVGSYENIKTFFNRLDHTERSQKVNLFSLATDVSAGALDAKHLIGTFEAELGYLPPKPVGLAPHVPIFRRSQFDFSNAEKLLEQATSAVPTLEKGQTGRPNPFQ